MYFSLLTVTYIELPVIDWPKVNSYLDTSLVDFVIVFNCVFCFSCAQCRVHFDGYTETRS